MRSVCALALSFCFTVSVCAGQSRTNSSGAFSNGGGNVSEFEVNGLKVIVKQRPGAQTVSAGLFLRGGSANITASNAGIEELLLSAAIDGSAKFPKASLRTELSKMATTISYGTNQDYSALSMACTREFFDRSWTIFMDVALHPLLAAGDVDLEKKRLIVQANDRIDTPDSYLGVLRETNIYNGHPYANSSSGTAASLTKITAEDLRTYHQQMMQTSRLLLVLVGDLDIYGMRARVTTSFGTMPRGNYHHAAVSAVAFTSPRVEIVQKSLPTNYIEGVFAGPPFDSADFAALQVASSILQDRVFVEVRIKRNLSYDPSAFLAGQSASVGGISVTAVDANQAVKLMLDEITGLKKEPVESSTLAEVVAQYITTYFLGIETSGAQAGTLAQYEIIGGGWQNAEALLDRIRAVKAADVQRVANQYMRNLQFDVIGDGAAINKRVFTGQP
jgi:predicted Zn-dependent peptidase